MPATYAHYRFGLDVIDTLPNAFHKSMLTKSKINYDLFMIGLHGPDILFFYKPYKKNNINQTGINLHAKPTMEFFQNALKVVKSFDRKKDYYAAYSYLCGVICHFSLDHACHPYIYTLTDEHKFYHSEIESEFDRMLLLEDHKNPYGQILTDHLYNSPYKAWIISRFYDCASPGAMFQVLHSFTYYNNLLCSHGFRRKLFEFFLIFSGNNYTNKMMISSVQNHKLDDVCKELHAMYDEAVPSAASLISDLTNNLHHKKPLDDIYLHSFGRE